MATRFFVILHLALWVAIWQRLTDQLKGRILCPKMVRWCITSSIRKRDHHLYHGRSLTAHAAEDQTILLANHLNPTVAV